MSRRATVAYVVKCPTLLGERYVMQWAPLTFTGQQRRAFRFTAGQPLQAKASAATVRGRAVRLVPKDPRAFLRGRLAIARADLARAEESKAALSEQLRGLETKVTLLERECERRAQKQAALECAIGAAKKALT